MNRSIVVVAGLGGMGALLAAGVWLGRAQASVTPAATALREDFRILVEATGSIDAAVFSEIGPPSVKDFWNYNLTWMIPEGARVREGQGVARFDAQTLEDRLRDQEAELEKVTQEKEKEQRDLEIHLRQLSLDLVEARGEIERVSVEASVPDELVPALDLAKTRLREKLARERAAFLEDKAAFQRELVRSKLELLEVKKARAQQKIEYYRAVRDTFEVKAPISGVVLYQPKPNGDRWEVGEGVWMLAKILKVADINTLQVEAQVLEVDAARIAEGQTAEIVVDALPGRVFQSRVREVGRMVHSRSMQDPTKVFTVILPLEKIEGAELRPGMSVRVAIEVERLEGSITVPLAAVRSSPTGPWVAVRTGTGRERRNVTLGPRDQERAVVVSGIEEGEQVLLGEDA